MNQRRPGPEPPERCRSRSGTPERSLRPARRHAAAGTSGPLRRARQWRPPRAPGAVRDGLRPLARRLPRSSHLLGGVLQLLAALLDVALDLLAASLGGQALVARRLAGGFLRSP